jgi:hypothetical protein
MQTARGTTPPEVTPATYKQVFEDSLAGAQVLENLIQIFAQDSVTTGGIDAVLKTFQRTGQRRVLDHIVKQINRANGVPDTQGEDDAT